jgi:prephenate dehydrogenase
MTSVAIIGGYGGMGQLFARILKRNGLDVTIAGPRPEKGIKVAKEIGVAFEKSNIEAANGADIVIITVPIRKTPDLIREIAPHMKEGALLTDLTSVKKAPCDAMLKSAPESVEIAGCHPVFGPMVGDFKNQNFVFCPIRQGKRFDMLKKIIRKEGGLITECSPEEHDKAMGVVQGMTHFMLISAGAAMRDMGFDPKKSSEFSSPVYQLVMDLIGRILGQDPSLYGEIQLENRETAPAREAFLSAAKRMDGIIRSGDLDSFIAEMEKAAKHFGDTEGAMKRTQKALKNEE